MKLNLSEPVGFVMSLLKLELQTKLEIQGHGSRQTSKLIKSAEVDIEKSATLLVASMLFEDYYIFIERGVKARNIPYSPGVRRGGTSKYIQGLIKYWRFTRGLNPKEAIRASFATANVHKKEGMPTRNSYRFSKDGTRLGFVSSTLDKNQNRIFELLEREVGNDVEIALTETLKQISKEIF